MSPDSAAPAAILYTNGPFTGVRSTVLPNPPPETLTGDADIRMGGDFEMITERVTYHRRECVEGVWLYEVRIGLHL